MSRVMQLAIFVFFALAAFAAMVQAEEKFLDDDGKEIEFFDSNLGDDDFENDSNEKRSLNIRGKSAFGLAARHNGDYGVTKLSEVKEKLEENNIKITWYAAHDLKDPACGNGHWDPNNNHHIGAVQKTWKNGPGCGEFVRLCNTQTDKCLKVRVVDECEGCSHNHVDLTKSAFRKLSTTGTLDEGISSGLHLYKSGKPNPWDYSLFGPFKLK